MDEGFEGHQQELRRGTIVLACLRLLRTAGGRFVARHSRATDVWALGMLLHCALYGGALPWRADLDDIAGLRAEMLAATEVRPPRGVRADVPPALLALLSRLLSLDPAQRQLSDQMIGYWSQFVKTGVPDVTGAPQWPPLGADAATGPRLSLQTGKLSIVTDFAARHQCPFWATVKGSR